MFLRDLSAVFDSWGWHIRFSLLGWLLGHLRRWCLLLRFVLHDDRVVQAASILDSTCSCERARSLSSIPMSSQTLRQDRWRLGIMSAFPFSAESSQRRFSCICRGAMLPYGRLRVVVLPLSVFFPSCALSLLETVFLDRSAQRCPCSMLFLDSGLCMAVWRWTSARWMPLFGRTI